MNGTKETKQTSATITVGNKQVVDRGLKATTPTPTTTTAATKVATVAPVKKPVSPKSKSSKKTAKVTKVAKPATPATPVKPAKAMKAAKATVAKSNYAQHAKNPFRNGTAYAACFNIMGSFGRKGCSKEEIVKLLAKDRKSDLKHAYYDCQVLLSAKDSNTGSRHTSCREGFWVKRENDHVVLMID